MTDLNKINWLIKEVEKIKTESDHSLSSETENVYSRLEEHAFYMGRINVVCEKILESLKSEL